MSRRIDLSLIAVLFVVNLLIRIPLTFGFDGLYGQDAYAYFDFAQEIVEGRASADFHWPLGYPALLASAFATFGVSALVGQMLNVLLGALLAPLVYILARQLNLKAVGAFVAALLMTVCGQAIQSSVVVMSDIPALFWALISAIALLRYTKHLSVFWLICAALTLALAAITRWIYLTLAVPYALVVLMAWGWRIRWRHAIFAAAAAALIFIPQLLYNLGENPYSWSGWTLDNAFRSTFSDTQGTLVYQQVNAVFFVSFLFDPYYLSPILIPFIALGIVALRKNTISLFLLLGWLLAPYFFSIGMPQQNIRFLLTSFPAAAILIGTGSSYVTSVGTRHASSALITAIKILVASVMLIALIHTLTTSRTTIDTFLTAQRQHQDAVIWALSQIPPDSTVYTFGVTLIMQHQPEKPREVYEIYYETPESLSAKWTKGQEDYLLLNVWHIENQWQGLAPQVVYHWLRDHRGLTQLGKHGNYTLFRVNG